MLDQVRTYQTIDVQPLAGALGAEIFGVDLAKGLNEETFNEIHQAWLDHLVIFFRDQDIASLSEDEVSEIRRKHIGIVFQSFYLIPNYTAVENVALTLELNKLKNPQQQAKELLDRFGLKNRFNNLPSQLSGGEQQRVAIARAIAMKPDLILADEPTGNLDSKNSVMISNILFKYVKEEGSSLIMVTHDPKLANTAKRKIKIKDGKIV